ncbi:MAG: hypothetical protein HYU56_03150 [Candidatus Aenigmarchaeota archaeon]|nr:hypothetical protein [Candidatus Aenigmarchaeota archaeon]
MTIWTKAYADTPIKDRAGINFPGTLSHLLQQGYRDYRASGMRGAFSPVQTSVRFTVSETAVVMKGGERITVMADPPVTVARFREAGYEKSLPTIELATERRPRLYVAEIVWPMDSPEREKMLGSPLINRIVRRSQVRDMSHSSDKEKSWELQLPLMLGDRAATDDIFNSLGVYFDLDFSKPWSIAAY